MPAGLDGNSDPIVTKTRSALLDHLADEVVARRIDPRPMLVAVDGIDGAGKSTFADELGARLSDRGLNVVRSSIDSFHHPRARRWRKGRTSPLGFYADSHDLGAVLDRLLDPLAAGVGSSYRTEVFDEPNDRPLDADELPVSGDEVLIFDGIFLCRPELVDRWDLVLFLDGAARVELDRLGLVLDAAPSEPEPLMAHVLDWVGRIDRYSSGMRIYLDGDDPLGRADFVVDNNDLANPRLVSSRPGPG